MNNNSYQQPEMEINLKEVIWDLLEQWKAVILVALLMAVLLAGAKYYKDSNTYKASMQAKEEISQSGKTPEERISDVLDALSDDEKATVEFMVNQNEWVETEKEYMNKSILLNTNPTNQRTLLLDYYISMADATEAKMTALVYGYAGQLTDENLVSALGEIIAPEAETKYIAELISLNGDNSGNGDSGGNGNSLIVDADADGAVMGVKVVLPDNVDATEVEKTMTAALSGYTDELRSKIGNHNFSFVKSSEAYLYNSAAVNNRGNITNTVFNLQNSIKNLQGSLTDEQKAAIETIIAIKKEGLKSESDDLQQSDGTATEPEITKPGVSKKYAMLGFVLGALAYAFVYLVLKLFKGQVNYASDVENYTQARLIGEIYLPSEHKGFRSLFHSKLVSKFRYGDKTDIATQIKKAVDVLDAVCGHADLREVTLYNIGGSGSSNEVAEQLISKAHAQGIELKPAETMSEIDERSLLAVDNALFMTNAETRAADVANLTGLCAEYDVNVVGNVFTRAI